MNPHPNATVALVSGAGGGEAVVEILDQVGVHVSTSVGVAIAGAVAALALFVGRNGFHGLIRALWDGTDHLEEKTGR